MTARDTIFLDGLEARGVIGVDAWERRTPQTIRVDLELSCDASAAAEQDDIHRTVNYRAVAKSVLSLVETSGCRLVETLAVRLAEMIQKDHGVAWVRVRVSKPGAVRFSQNVGVEVVRGAREGHAS